MEGGKLGDCRVVVGGVRRLTARPDQSGEVSAIRAKRRGALVVGRGGSGSRRGSGGQLPSAVVMVLLVQALSSPRSAHGRQCYVWSGSDRIVKNTSAIVECPVHLYGPNPACGYSCARHKETKQDLCSFYCMPSRHCSSTGLIRPDFEMSAGNFLPGCPAQANYAPIESTDLECNAECCQLDACNDSDAPFAAPARLLVTAACLLAVAVPLLYW